MSICKFCKEEIAFGERCLMWGTYDDPASLKFAHDRDCLFDFIREERRGRMRVWVFQLRNSPKPGQLSK